MGTPYKSRNKFGSPRFEREMAIMLGHFGRPKNKDRKRQEMTLSPDVKTPLDLLKEGERKKPAPIETQHSPKQAEAGEPSSTPRDMEIFFGTKRAEKERPKNVSIPSPSATTPIDSRTPKMELVNRLRSRASSRSFSPEEIPASTPQQRRAQEFKSLQRDASIMFGASPAALRDRNFTEKSPKTEEREPSPERPSFEEELKPLLDAINALRKQTKEHLDEVETTMRFLELQPSARPSSPVRVAPKRGETPPLRAKSGHGTPKRHLTGFDRDMAVMFGKKL